MFGHEPTGVVRVFRYGCGAPISGMEDAYREMRLRNDFWNKLVELQREFLVKYRALISSPVIASYDGLQSAIKDKYKEIKKSKQAAVALLVSESKERDSLLSYFKQACDSYLPLTAVQTAELDNAREITGKKKRKPVPYKFIHIDIDPLQTKIADLKYMLKYQAPLVQAERDRLKLEHASEIQELKDQLKAASKKARQESGLYWGNYNAVMASRPGSGTSNFHGWKGDGNLTVQFQKRKDEDCPSTASVFNLKQPLMRIDPVNLHRDPNRPGKWIESRAERRGWRARPGRPENKGCCTTVHFRVDAAANWVVLPLYMDRPLPVEGKIVGATLMHRKLGFRNAHILKTKTPNTYAPFKDVYELHITVRMPEAKPCPTARPEIAIRFGWTLSERNALRVASWKDSNGDTGEFFLPGDPDDLGFVTKRKGVAPHRDAAGLVTQFKKLEELRSIYDQYRDIARDEIQKFREANTGMLPSWFTEVTSFVSNWKGATRFLQTLLALEKHRLAGDEVMFAALSKYQERYHHLYGWEFHWREKLQYARKEAYRIFAKQLTEKYGRIIMLDSDLQFAAQKKTRKSFTAQDNYRRMACVSSLKTVIEHTAQREGLSVAMVSPEALPEATLEALLAFKMGDSSNVSDESVASDDLMYKLPESLEMQETVVVS